MIQYDRNMSPEDLVAYWSGGYVIAKATPDGPWALARVHRATGKDVTLMIAKNVITLTRDVFFNEVILHRPVVNLVEYAGVVYRLTWMPPQRDAARAISTGVLRYKQMNPQRTISAVALVALQRWQAEFMSVTPETRGLAVLPPPFGDEPPQNLSMTLLLHLLNCKHTNSAKEQVLRVLDSPAELALLINHDEYVHRSWEGVATIYAGCIPLCTVTQPDPEIADLVVTLSSDITPQSCWWRRGQELIRELHTNRRA